MEIDIATLDNPVDEIVPIYTVNDETCFESDQLLVDADSLQLPLTTYPPYSARPSTSDSDSSSKDNIRQTQVQIINSFHDAVSTKKLEAVSLLVQRGFVSPDVPNAHGVTPLLAAVAAGDATMVRGLVALGATVNAFGISPAGLRRTPLQLAAFNGNLVLVRLLMEELGADDAMIAPDDGQTALRLAADAGQRDVVAYLPARRGGEWQRWRYRHSLAWSRIVRAVRAIGWACKVVFWYLPKVIVWYAPKHFVVLPIRDGVVWTWKHRKEFGPWCRKVGRSCARAAAKIPRLVARAAKATPRLVARAAKGLRRAVVRAPGAVADAAKELAKAVKELAEVCWTTLKKVPKATAILLTWVWQTLCRIGSALLSVLERLVGVLHTAVMAVANFFRSITLRDVYNGIVSVLTAIFIDLPKAIWTAAVNFGEATYKFLVALFGILGAVVWYLVVFTGWAIVAVVWYVPQQLLDIVLAAGTSIGGGIHEVLVWFNPKL